MLYKLNESVLKQENNEKTLSEIVNCLKNLRILSINIVNHLSKIREMCSYSVLRGKFELNKINKVYLFDKNYLIKMKYDLDFLKNSKIASFYGIAFDESDPFLLNIRFVSRESDERFTIKPTDVMLTAIKQAQFLILQDLIFFHISNLNSNVRNTAEIRSLSPRNHSSKQKSNSGTRYGLGGNTKLFAKEKIIKLYSPPKNFYNKIHRRPYSSGAAGIQRNPKRKKNNFF